MVAVACYAVAALSERILLKRCVIAALVRKADIDRWVLPNASGGVRKGLLAIPFENRERWRARGSPDRPPEVLLCLCIAAAVTSSTIVVAIDVGKTSAMLSATDVLVFVCWVRSSSR